MSNEALQQSYQGVFDGRLGFGTKPALLIVDFIKAYTTPGAALYAPPVVAAVQETVGLLDLARRKRVLTVYTRVIYAANGWTAASLCKRCRCCARWSRASRWPRLWMSCRPRRRM